MSRRRFLRLAGVLGLGGSAAATLLAACQPAASTPTAAPTAAPAKPAAQPTTAPAQPAATAAPAAPAAAASPAAKPTAAPAAKPGPTVGVKVGVVGAGSFSPFTAGVALGSFEKDGLKVEVIEHRGGAEAAQAMVGGGLDIFNGDFSHALRLNEQGQAIRVIAGTTDRHAYVLLGAPGATPGVQSIKGQKIGITSPGSQTDNSLRWLLKSNGMDPDKDAELVAVGGGTTMLAAIQNKQVYAGMLVEPFTTELRQKSFVTVYDFTEQVGPFQGTVMMAKQSYLKDNAEPVKRFLASYLSLVKALRSDAAVRNEAAAKIYPSVDPRIREAAVAEMVKSYPADGKVTEQAVAKVFEFDKVARGTSDATPSLSTFSDFSFLPAS